jgi:hypothetical protein
VAEHRDGVLVIARRRDVADAFVDAGEERILVHGARQMTAREPRQLLWILGGDLLDRDVVREISVVLGETVVDVDVQSERVGDGLCGLHRSSLRTAHKTGDREAGQCIGQPLGLLDAFLGEVGVRPLTRLAAKRQRMPDQ